MIMAVINKTPTIFMAVAMMIAIKYDNLDAIKLLLIAGADIGHVTHFDANCLHFAAI